MRNCAVKVKNVSVLVAVGVDQDSFRQVLGVKEKTKEDKKSWIEFLRYLKSRGFEGVRFIVSDKCLELVKSLVDFYPEAKWQ